MQGLVDLTVTASLRHCQGHMVQTTIFEKTHRNDHLQNP